MGVGIGDDDWGGVVRWIGALPSATVGAPATGAAVRRELAPTPGLDVTGAWLVRDRFGGRWWATHAAARASSAARLQPGEPDLLQCVEDLVSD